MVQLWVMTERNGRASREEDRVGIWGSDSVSLFPLGTVVSLHLHFLYLQAAGLALGALLPRFCGLPVQCPIAPLSPDGNQIAGVVSSPAHHAVPRGFLKRCLSAGKGCRLAPQISTIIKYF